MSQLDCIPPNIACTRLEFSRAVCSQNIAPTMPWYFPTHCLVSLWGSGERGGVEGVTAPLGIGTQNSTTRDSQLLLQHLHQFSPNICCFPMILIQLITMVTSNGVLKTVYQSPVAPSPDKQFSQSVCVSPPFQAPTQPQNYILVAQRNIFYFSMSCRSLSITIQVHHLPCDI